MCLGSKWVFRASIVCLRTKIEESDIVAPICIYLVGFKFDHQNVYNVITNDLSENCSKYYDPFVPEIEFEYEASMTFVTYTLSGPGISYIQHYSRAVYLRDGN
jgi:hypothetical protein